MDNLRPIRYGIYNAIVSSQGIHEILSRWMYKIKMFMIAFQIDNEEVFRVLENPTEMCGYTLIQNDNDYATIMNNGTQREKLSCIYQFAMKMSGLIWSHVLPLNNATNILQNLNINQEQRIVFDINNFMNKIKDALLFFNINIPIVDLETCITNARVLFQLVNDEPDGDYIKSRIYLTFSSILGNDPLDIYFPSRIHIPPYQHPYYKVKLGDLVEPLSERELAFMINSLNAQLEYIPPEQAEQLLLPWVVGSALYSIPDDSLFGRLTITNSKKNLCGISGSTQMMIECAKMFGIDVRYVFLAITPWMETVQDHSLFEIVFMGQRYLPEYPYYLHANGGRNEEFEIQYILAICQNLGIIPLNMPGGRRHKIAIKKNEATIKRIPKKKTGGKHTFQTNCNESKGALTDYKWIMEDWKNRLPKMSEKDLEKQLRTVIAYKFPYGNYDYAELFISEKAKKKIKQAYSNPNRPRHFIVDTSTKQKKGNRK